MKKVEHRNYSLIVYADNINEIVNQCKCINNILYYAVIMHDKDIDKKIHYHLLLILRSARTYTTVVNYFDFKIDNVKQNILIEPVFDLNKAYEYLYHLNDKDKYQYNEIDIICNDKSRFISKLIDKDNSISIINDLCNKKSLREMAQIYGKEFIYRYKAYKEFVSDMLFQENYNSYVGLLKEFQNTDIDDCIKI